jgi:hypothetical protein
MYYIWCTKFPLSYTGLRRRDRQLGRNQATQCLLGPVLVWSVAYVGRRSGRQVPSRSSDGDGGEDAQLNLHLSLSPDLFVAGVHTPAALIHSLLPLHNFP